MRLIDVDKRPCKTCGVEYCREDCKKYIAWLNDIVDAVEVVRCKDCKHRGDGYACPMYFLHAHCDDDDYTSDDGFCDRGARMDEEEP